jgi:hypothetical protein
VGPKSHELHKEFSEGPSTKASGHLAKSECLSEEGQIKLLLESIRGMEGEIREREAFYGKTVAELAENIQAKSSENAQIRAEIQQLKNEARSIRRESQALVASCREGRPGVRKSTSSRNIMSRKKTEHLSENRNRSPFLTKSTHKSAWQGQGV